MASPAATRVCQNRFEPSADTSPTTRAIVSSRRRVMTAWQATQWGYHWALWFFLVGLVGAQFSCVFWDLSTRYEAIVTGQIPSVGPHNITTEVDPEPYADRIVVCVLNGGRQYQPMQLSRALARQTDLQQEDLTSINGYRVVRRTKTLTVSPSHFSSTCDLVATTLDAILDSCVALGYNVTQDYVRIVDGLGNAADIVGITDSLPVLIEPVGDDNPVSRYIVPGHDGIPCVVRLLGKYETPRSTSQLILRGVSRAVYTQRTLTFLHLNTNTSSGVWRNGWYETLNGSKWHSEVISTRSDGGTDVYGLSSRVFDTGQNAELAVTTPTAWPVEFSWGSVASASDTVLWYQSITISNGNNFGVYRYESAQVHEIRATYTLETLLVNLSISWILLRWVACMIALQRGFHRDSTVSWQSASIGSCVSCMHTFQLLPLVLLVRLKNIFAAFWTVGGYFSGPQRAASEAWFVIYPSIAELVLLKFSVMNMAAKGLGRRVSDVLFGPTLGFLCILHLVRCFVFVHPRPSVVSSAELESLSLPAVIFTNVVMRLNGNIKWLFVLKVVVLLSNWLALWKFSRSNDLIRKHSHMNTVCRVEQVLALQGSNLGGFGTFTLYTNGHTKAREGIRTLATANNIPSVNAVRGLMPIEPLRMGYVVLGGCFLLLFNDYLLLLVLAPWRRCKYPPQFRIVIFSVEQVLQHNRREVHIAYQPEFVRINDPRLQSLDLFDISAVTMS